MKEGEKLEIETSDKEELAQVRAINNKYLPYDKPLCEATLEKLKTTTYINQDISQQLVDDIITDQELNGYSLIVQGDFNRSKIQQSWETCEKNMYSQTIRNIQNIDIAIIDYENEKGKSFTPYKYQTIGLYKWSFIKWAKEILAANEEVIFIAESNKDSQFIDWDTLDNEGFKLKPINNPYLLKNCFDIIFVDKSIFKYTSEAGLELGEGNRCSPLKPYDKKEKENIKYKKDTFWQHNKAIIGCYERIFNPNNKLQFTFSQLNEYWGETIDWNKLIKAIICLHDYGKLNIEWQRKMKLLQKLKDNGNYYPDEVLAHSDFNELTDKEIEKQSGAKNKPPHAGAGAFALIAGAEEIIDAEDFEELANPIATAILKHHGVETETYPDFEIADKDYTQIEKLLQEIGVTVNLKRKARGGKLTDYFPTNKVEWVIYLFLVRILRLSDQKATIDFEKYLKQ